MSRLLRLLGSDARRPRLRTRPGGCVDGDDPGATDADAGFSLVETVVSLSIFALLMTSVAVVFVGGIRSSADMQRRQTAATLAAQAIELTRAVPPAPDTNLCPRLLQGRSQSAVTTQTTGLPSDVDLSGTDLAWMPTTCTGATVIPLQGLGSVAGAAPVDPVRVAGSDYTVRTVIGTCRMPRAGGSCVSSLTAPADSVTLFRVVVSVSWSGVGCAQGCSYSAATLIDPSSDPLFNSRATTPGPPVNLSAVAGDASAVLAWQAPTTALDVPIIRYTATLTPNDGGSTRTCTVAAPMVTCTATGLTNGVTYVASVVAESAYGLSSPSSTVTVIPYPAGVLSATNLKLWLDGADGATLFQNAACSTPATSGQSIGCWKDKSVQLNHAMQATTANQAKVSTLNSLTAPTFDGSSSRYPLDVTRLPIGTTPSAVYTVAVQEDTTPTTSGYRHIIGWGSTSTGAGRVVEKGSGSTTAYLDTFNTWASMTPTKPWQTSVPTVFDGTVTSTQVTADMNGSLSYTYSGAANTGTASGALLGAAPWSTTAGWKGRIAEVIVLSAAPSATDNRAVQEYLARKWGAAITPQAPSGVVAVGAAASASVSWTAPAWDGGAAVSSYTVVATPPSGPVVTRTGCAASPCAVTGLSAATTYSFTVAAVNTSGTGPASSPATATTLGGPGAPTALVATPGDTTLGIAWTPPASNGGSPITGYTVTATPAGGGSTVTCTSATTTCSLTGLTNGVAYTATVTSTTAIGTSPTSTPITSIPYPAALITSTAVKLWLDAADLDADGAVGGTAGEAGTVSGAVQTWKDRSGGGRDTTAPSAAERPSYVSRTLNGLPVVTATGSQVLNGAVSASPYGITGDRTLVVVTRPRVWTAGTSASGDGTYLVDRANGSTGNPLFGLKVCGSSYCVQQRTDLGGTATAVTGTTGPQVGSTDILLAVRSGTTDSLIDTGSVVGSGTLSGAITQQAVSVGRHSTATTTQDVDIAEVLLFNKALSAAEQSTVQTYLARKWGVTLTPSAPTAVTTTPGNAQLAVAWTAPSFDGGSPITSYTVTAVPSDAAFATRTCTTATTGCTVTGLSNGMSYTVSVTATNAATTSPASAAVTDTPTAPYALDGISATPAVAYGLRKLRSAYAGPAIGVRRSDGATTTIGFDVSGDLDTTALSSFCNAWWLYCYVSTWYDQSGNGRNATQGWTGRQPTIYAAGVAKTANGLPTLEFAGGQNLITSSSAVPAGGSTMTGNVVGLAQSYSGAGRFVSFVSSADAGDSASSGSASLVQRNSSSSRITSYRNFAYRGNISGSDGVLGSHTNVFDGANSTMYSGGSSSTSVASTGTFGASGAVTIGSDKDWSDNLSGDISEVVLFTSALGATDRTALMSSQRTYFAAPTVVVPVASAGTVAVRTLAEGFTASRSGLSGAAASSGTVSRGGVVLERTTAAQRTPSSGGRP